MSSPLPVMVLWHLHQPLYRRPDREEFVLPWVRKHTIREYHDMAEMIERYPEIAVTVNWTPVLLQQIREYADGSRDRLQNLRDRDPDELTPEEQFELLAGAFKAHPGTIIEPYPRFRELKEKWDRSRRLENADDVVSDWDEQELFDCQVWSTLGWFGFSAAERFPGIAELREKGHGFDKQDKQQLGTIERELMTNCLPRWQSVYDETPIEFSTSPYYHPIGPLLCQYEDIDEAMPGVPKPERPIEWPEDARWHLQEAAKSVSEWLDIDRDELGLWPSEGSVSERFMELIAEAGFRWTATDEAILKRALPEDDIDTGTLNQAHAWHGELPVFFRNHDLSDRIGFDYSKMSTDEALNNFFGTCDSIADRTDGQNNRVLSVILDGENPWEYFEDAGESFIAGLYEQLLSHDQTTPVTPKQYLSNDRDLNSLSRMPAGSWINGDFNIWGGSALDVRAWDLLAETREALRGWENLSDDEGRRCWRSLYAAQGSDWFWWYGEPFQSADDEIFDQLYRGFLLSIYNCGGHPEPSYLHHPMQSSESPGYNPPRSFISPEIDGHESHYREWWGAARITPKLEVGTMAKGSERFRAIRFGSNLDTLFGRFDFENEPPEDTVCRIHLEDQTFTAGPISEDNNTMTDEDGNPVNGSEWTYERILEWKLPIDATNTEPGQYCQFKVELMQDGHTFDQFPFADPLAIPILDRKKAAGEWTV